MKNTGYVCLMILLRMLEVKADSKNLESSFSEDGETDLEIIRAAKQLGLKVKLSSFHKKTFSKHNIPVIAKTKDNEFILILGTRDEGCLILDPKEGNSKKISFGKLDELITVDIILIGKKAKDSSGDVTAGKKFGFSWFIPTILKYKKQFITVLLSVFVIQILGILTPLMTQVVVDKVLSHKALNTLYTIAIGIFIVYVYELIISLCKSYLFVHTTSRIDVILSSRLFKHLFSLPLKYFENRRAGETVARVRELDHIRSYAGWILPRMNWRLKIMRII